MSLAALERATMTHRCTVERDGSDPLDHRAATGWQTHLADQACFLYTRRIGGDGRESVRVEGTAVVEEWAAAFPLGTDITERDRIKGVRDRDGSDIEPGIFSIRSVKYHHDHLEAVLTQVN